MVRCSVAPGRMSISSSDLISQRWRATEYSSAAVPASRRLVGSRSGSVCGLSTPPAGEGHRR